MWYKKRYYNTDNGIVDISKYDDNEKIKFFIVNPNAVEATERETRDVGLTRPNSEIVSEENRIASELEEKEKDKFIYLKYGTMNQRSGTYMGGKGDNVYREDFENDAEWERYQMWNTGKKKVIPLNEQVNERVRANDLDVSVQTSDYYYNRDKKTDFVDSYYDSKSLEEAGIDAANFQGYLESSGYKDEFDDYVSNNSFDGNMMSDQKELDIAKNRILKDYLEGYLQDENNRLTEKLFVDDYYHNQGKYKDYKDYFEAYEAFKTEQFGAKSGGGTVFDYEKLNAYTDVNYKNVKDRDALNKRNFIKHIDDVEQQSDVVGGGAGALEFFGSGIGGIWSGVDELGITLADWFWMDGVANRRRLIDKEQNLGDAEANAQYMLFKGKIGKIDGIEYGVKDNGSIYNITENRNVTNALTVDEIEKITKTAEKENWEEGFDWSARGSSNMTGHVIGNVMFQILGTKGAGYLRGAASLKYLAAANGFKNVAQYEKYLRQIKLNPKRLKQFGANNKGTFGKKLPFDARIVDATNFQTFYGATTGYEKTLNAAMDAGIPRDEAEKLARAASGQMALLYGVTGPINPRLGGMKWLDNQYSKIFGNKQINNVINAYKNKGLKGANDQIKKGIKSFIPTNPGQMNKAFWSEGAREVLQENIQQGGEFLLVNKNLNEMAGQEFLKQDYNLRDFIETSVLSLAAGGLVGGFSAASTNTVNSQKAQLQDMWSLSKNMKKTKELLGGAVDNEMITQEEADELYKSIQSIGKASLPAWMINTPEEYIEAAKVQNALEVLKRKAKKSDDQSSTKDQIAALEKNYKDIVKKASEAEINKEIDFVGKVVGKKNIKVFNTPDEIIKAGFSSEMFTDGWFESNGVIYINKQIAAANQAVSVASHELLHKILKAEFKGNPEIQKVVSEFKEILKDKGIWSAIERREALYIADGRADLDGADADEYLTMFSDALAKNEIPFEALEESQWKQIGRSIMTALKKKLPKALGGQTTEFATGRQVYDFILDYHKNIKKGRISNQAQRMLDMFEPEELAKDDKGNTINRKRSINIEKESNQEILNNLDGGFNEATGEQEIEFIKSQQFQAAKALIDNGAFDRLIGAKLASGSNIFGRPREEVMEEIRAQLVRHLENFNPAKNKDLFAYLNSYIGRKVGTVTTRIKKRRVRTTPLTKDIKGETVETQIADAAPNPEEQMIIAEQQAAALIKSTELKMGKKLDPETVAKVKKLIVPIIRDMDVKLTADKSINAKNSPMIKYLKNALKNSLVYDAMIAELGKGEVTKKMILKFKKDVLKNATTTWLQGKTQKNGTVNGGIPQAIDKVIKLQDGSEVRVSYPDWVGEEIAREKMGTDNAGRSAGHDLVFRNEEEISDEVYMSQFYKDGKLIRNRKESLAEEMAKEIGIEIILDELVNNPTGEIAQAFEQNQLAKNVMNAVQKIGEVFVQADRSGIKRSISANKEVAIARFERLAILGYEGNFKSLAMEKEMLRGTPYEFIIPIYEENFALNVEALTGFIEPMMAYAETLPESNPTKKYIQEFLAMDKTQKIKAIASFSEELAKVIPPELFKIPNLGYDFLGVFDRVVKPNSPEGLKIKKAADSEVDGEVPAWMEDILPIFSTGGVVGSIVNKIQNKVFETEKEAQEEFDKLYAEKIEKANIANVKLFNYIVDAATKVVAKKPSLMPGYLALFQSNTGDIIKGMRAFGILQDVEIHATNQAPFISKDGAKGYRSINATNKEAYDAGEIQINYNHPLFTRVKKYVDDQIADLQEQLANTTAPKAREKLLKRINKDRDQLYRDLLRPYTEHKNPASNKFGEIAMDQMVVLSKIIGKGLTDSQIDVAINAYQLHSGKLADIISDFTMTINTSIISKLQDEAFGKTSNLGDARVLAVDEKYIKSFYPMKGQVPALKRADNALKADVDLFVKIMELQNAINTSNSTKRSLSPKGISVYDFDDTLAFSKSKIIVTMPSGKVTRITPAKFATDATKLEQQGAKFDFSEFNDVVDGKPGPLIPRLRKAIDKFGNKNIFVLTARPQASALAIYKFLKGLGVEIPLENITGLENGKPSAKANWMIGKIAKGYNDFYFVDDAMKNVSAVKQVLENYDVKGKVQQAIIKRKRSLNIDINQMIERNTGVGAEKTYSKVLARKKGAGKFQNPFITYSAEDFRGLTSYTLAGKGKQGEKDQEFFEENLINPYIRGVAAMETIRQAMKNEYNRLLKANPALRKKINKEVPGLGFTHDQVIRIYLYNKAGYEVPGISKRDLKAAVDFVTKNEDIELFANEMLLLTKGNQWVQPDEFWDVGSLLKDLNTFNDDVNRKEYLSEFIENVDAIFDEVTLNKLEAIYGTKYRKALENIIARMKSGSNRPGKMGTTETKWMNWLNNSVGSIMFFNRRSALLQMLSFANFTNWSDNNPIAAAAAFANQPLYWKTWVRIFNSDKLKQRRGGLKSDLQEQEIASAAKNSKGKPEAIIAYLLKIGFTPTQIADSMAIATGGASFLINRTKTYLNQGMSQEEADAKAFEDFSKISDETQQSGDPMLISSQQASHLGRIILAFQNTPMQYTRLIKKAAQDLYNGRGDAKTNISKIIYYGFVQNLIFNGLQQALFALTDPFFDDDEEEYEKELAKKEVKIINGMIDSIVRGTGLYGAIAVGLKNTYRTYMRQEAKGYRADHAHTLIELANVSPPLGSKMRKVYSSILEYKYNKALIKERGWSLTADGRVNVAPNYMILANLVSAGFNLPLDRAIIEINGISESLDNRNNAMQRIALLLGFRTWDVNAKNEENDFIEAFYKELKELEKKKKRGKKKK